MIGELERENAINQMRELNLLDLSELDKVELQRMIDLINGNAFVLVHPFADLHRITMTKETILPKSFDQETLTCRVIPEIQDLDDKHRFWRSRQDPRVCLQIVDVVRHALGEKIMNNEQLSMLGFTHNNVMPLTNGCRSFNKDTNDLTIGYRNYLKSLARYLRVESQVIFLAETKINIQETVQAMRAVGYRGLIVFFQTYNSGTPSPTLLLDDLKFVAQQLGDLGVCQLRVGGQYSEFNRYDYRRGDIKEDSSRVFQYSRALRQRFEGDGCVGLFCEQMNVSGRFNKITLSSISFPWNNPSLLSKRRTTK